MLRPSGLKAGELSAALSLVSGRALPPLVGTSQISVAPRFSSTSKRVTVTAAKVPSGEIAVSPSRASVHILLAVRPA